MLFIEWSPLTIKGSFVLAVLWHEVGLEKERLVWNVTLAPVSTITPMARS